MNVKPFISGRVISYASVIIYLIAVPPISVIAYEIFIKNTYVHIEYFSQLEPLCTEMDDVIYGIKKYRDANGRLPTQLNEIRVNRDTLLKLCRYKYSFKNPSASCIFALFVNNRFYYVIDSKFNKQIIRSEEYPYVEAYKFDNGGASAKQ